MQCFDFDKLTERIGTDSYKWDVKPGELPMWVADMDFETPEQVKRAVVARAEQGIYGYSTTPDELFEAYSAHWERRYGAKLPTECMVYSNGVVAAISSMVRRLTHPAESVLIQAPVYNIFYNSVLNNGRNVLSSDLVYRDGGYEIDFADLEEKLSRPSTTLMILCNPHNPVGRIWSRDELCRIGELCKTHGVTVISDEVHCAMTAPGRCYTPFAAASDTCAEISVSCLAASKTYNLAGLQSAVLFIRDPALRYRVWRGINNDEVGEPNCFSVRANIAALNECDGWVDALREYVFENKSFARDYINGRINGLTALGSDATYLLWVDISGVCPDSVEFCQRLRESTGLILSDGAEYGECGRGFVRINLATQRARVEDGLSRLSHFVESILKGN